MINIHRFNTNILTLNPKSVHEACTKLWVLIGSTLFLLDTSLKESQAVKEFANFHYPYCPLGAFYDLSHVFMHASYDYIARSSAKQNCALHN